MTLNNPGDLDDYINTGPALVEGDSLTALCSFVEQIFAEQLIAVKKEDVIAVEQSPALRTALRIAQLTAEFGTRVRNKRI